MSCFFLLPILALSAGLHSTSHGGKPHSKVVVGYIRDSEDAAPAVSTIDFQKITHLNVAFANPVDASGTLSVPHNLGDFVSHAHQNRVKVLVSIGGGGASTNDVDRKRYFDLISGSNRAGFVQKLVQYCDLNHLDGIDVDLEGPAVNGDYASFVGDLSRDLKKKGKLVTAAVSQFFGGDQITADALSHLDLVNVMAYDATAPWDPKRPGQHSSMDYAKSTVAYWLGRGVPKSKLVLGVPFYGYGFGDAFTKDGYTFQQIITQFPGAEANDQAGNTVWYNGTTTIRAKAKYAVDEGLAGIMIWALDQDGTGNQSLLTAIHEVLGAK